MSAKKVCDFVFGHFKQEKSNSSIDVKKQKESMYIIVIV